MTFILQPWHILFVVLCGWVNERQQKVIEFQNAQIDALLKKLRKKRLLLSDDQRRVLAVKAHVLGRKALLELTTIVTPDTILRWHRELVAKKWDHSDKRKTVGRPRIHQEIVDLILRLAKENPTWGYDRIQGALANLGHSVSDQTVGNILKLNGIEPAPERKRQMTWRTFLRAHWDTLAAIDFTTTEVWTFGGLVTMYILVVMDIKSRRIQIAGVTARPDGVWVRQVARNLTDPIDGFLRNHTHILVDRDTKFLPLRDFLEKNTEIEPVVLPPRSPNCNANIERFFSSLKSESLERMIFFSEAQLRKALSEFTCHYHAERNHQGLENQLIAPGGEVGQTTGIIECRERLGGLLRYYHRRAA